MSLEEFLKPVKYVDEQVLRQYTKVGKRLKLDEGRRKYTVGMGLWVTHLMICAPIGRELIGAAELPIRMILNIPDYIYNFEGIMGMIKEETTSENKTIDPIINFYRKHNSVARLPIFTAGIGLIGKCGVDLFNYITKGEPMESDSYNSLIYGIGLLSLASSMYIKEIDPKLLDKQPFYKAAYGWMKEKLIPAPQPITAYSTLEDKI